VVGEFIGPLKPFAAALLGEKRIQFPAVEDDRRKLARGTKRELKLGL
jgi:hypothetical protein